MAACIVLIWIPVEHWYKLQYLIPDAIVKNCEICFAWCQSIAFYLLCKKLSQFDSSSPTPKSDNFKNIDICLVFGLIFCNLMFAMYIIFLILTSNDYNEGSFNSQNRNDLFVKIELFCWSVETFSAVVLIASALLTVFHLRKMFGSDFNKESFRMNLIITIFCLAFLSKTIYQWLMFYYREKKQKHLVLMLF